MSLFAGWLVDAARPLGDVSLIAAPAAFLSAKRKGSKAAKWLAYLDQYVVLPMVLAWRSRRFDFVIIADQGNAPSSVFVPRPKLVIMVHDTIAMRQALDEIAEAPRTGLSGRILQTLIRHSIKRARLLLSNPGAIPGEIFRLRLGTAVAVVGCPADYSRLKDHDASSPIQGQYILNVAGDGWRKRKESLVPLWSEIQRRSQLRLVMAGHTGSVTREAFNSKGVTSVIFLDDVSDATLASLYAHCEALITPSHEEGLCIPVLEALHFGKPVFAPDISPSYVDFFGGAVHRLDMSEPTAAAEEILSTLEGSRVSEKAAKVREWATPAAFESRVTDALSALK